MRDVVVVGGGPAGAATALHLARGGLSVLLLERAHFPRRKACGEGLFPRGVRELRALGALDCIAATPVLQELRFHGYGETARAALGSAEAPALGVRRDLLDTALLALAREAGAEVHEGCRTAGLILRGDSYAVVGENAPLEARAIVVADGLNSRLRREAGLEVERRGQRYGVTGHVELGADAGAAVDVHFRPGYEVYVTPVGARQANVAVLMSKPMTSMLAGDASAAFEALLRRDGCLGKGWRLTDEPLVAGPFPARARGLFKRNLVLVGDAAGFFDGITGEGISLALASARDCAEAVDEFLRSGSSAPLAAYENRRRRLARNSELLGRLTLLLAARPWTAKRALRALARRPQTFRKLAAVSSGEARLSSLRPWDLLRLLLG